MKKYIYCFTMGISKATEYRFDFFFQLFRCFISYFNSGINVESYL